MVTDRQVRILMKLIPNERTLEVAAAKAGMSEKTARKYRRSGKLPSQCHPQHTWQTREDAFSEDWPWVEEQLQLNAGLEAKTLFEALQRQDPGKYQEGQLRTLQRRVKHWRATRGPAKEIFFPQVYPPGVWAESDFTRMNPLRVTIAGIPFDHMVYHFVLPYSNWETGTVCFSESYESLSTGLQNALWQLGGVPRHHRTDRLTAAVNKVGHPQEFTDSYQALADHYGFLPAKIQAGCPHENGDVEQRHHRFKRAVDQALMLRGRRDFDSRQEYEGFLRKLLDQLNAGRRDRLRQELPVLRRLPSSRLEDFRRVQCTVGAASTIRVLKNTYSVHSRLIGEKVEVRVYADCLEVWYAQRKVEQLPRLRGEHKHRIEYRHIIDWLVRKPGAFANYRYKEDLFPSSAFRMAYDSFHRQYDRRQAAKEYLQLLYLAAHTSETAVHHALRRLMTWGDPLSSQLVGQMVQSDQEPDRIPDIDVGEVDLAEYDHLLERQEVMV